MMKNSTPLILLSAIGLSAFTPVGCGDSGDDAADEVGDADGDTTGDGDGDTTGDGDGDTTGDGDGDTTGDGDGDGDTTGDGDGDTTGDGDGDGDGDTGGGIDEQAILDAVADYPNSFVLINAEPYISDAHMGGGIHVNVYVDPDNAAQYKTIDPDNPANITMPEGTIIVKEHLDDQMAVQGGTVMVKGPASYNPDANDWWFGVGDLLGGTLADSGPDLGGCIGCHMTVSQTDWLYGIPPADQNP